MFSSIIMDGEWITFPISKVKWQEFNTILEDSVVIRFNNISCLFKYEEVLGEYINEDNQEIFDFFEKEIPGIKDRNEFAGDIIDELVECSLDQIITIKDSWKQSESFKNETLCVQKKTTIKDLP